MSNVMSTNLRNRIVDEVNYGGALDGITLREFVIDTIDYMTFDDPVLEKEYREHEFTTRDYRDIENKL